MGVGVVVLAGGAGRRLGGVGKPGVVVAGKPMVARVLEAVGGADEVVVVGPAALGLLVPAEVAVVQEEPAGGGPVAGLAAGLAVIGSGRVLVLAADLPLLTRPAVEQLLGALGRHDGAVFVDDAGRKQWLCGAWSGASLRKRVNELAAASAVGRERVGEPEVPGSLAGRSMREFVAPLDVVGVPVGAGGGAPPWYDCDTPEELAGAELELGGGR